LGKPSIDGTGKEGRGLVILIEFDHELVLLELDIGDIGIGNGAIDDQVGGDGAELALDEAADGVAIGRGDILVAEGAVVSPALLAANGFEVHARNGADRMKLCVVANFRRRPIMFLLYPPRYWD